MRRNEYVAVAGHNHDLSHIVRIHDYQTLQIKVQRYLILDKMTLL